ncbi:MAG: SGNH/GDSL hydrolase family protein, partial [Clostridia bacterium]|nr:SGNH/GDSL hydrolase family protein [Clostridia bacterium]
MDISKADKNLKVETKIEKDDIIWLDPTQEPFVIYGAAEVSPYARIPSDIAETVSESVAMLNKHTSGIRVRFRTNSSYVAVKAEWGKQTKMSKMTNVGMCGFDFFFRTETDGRYRYNGTFTPPSDSPNGYESVLNTSGEMLDYIINFPLYNCVDKLYIGVESGATFEKPQKYYNELPVVFYGSSITQGASASRPGNSYQNFLSRQLNMDYINLGFSGSGRAEDEIVNYMAGLKMSAFVSDYDHNAPTVEHLEKTHYKMYETIRKAHPELPFIMISKPDYKTVLHKPNFDDERRQVIMETFQKAIANGDKN